jgi:hypothetical protein
MSIGPLGTIGSIAGTPLSQTKGSDVEKAAADTEHRSRTSQAQQRAESAAGIGQTAEDSEASDRDADGRRPWEAQQQPPQEQDADAADDSLRSKDATGMRGITLDLSG